jgi:hypothetical protein
MARSVAILLMLEGHFITVTLMEEYRRPDHLIYQIWDFFRGVAAPMFFTVAGMVFVYLLTRDRGPDPWFKNPRIGKGLKRAVILLFWGYLLQLKVWEIPAILRGEASFWLSRFHVLQCIGVGLVLLIGIFALQRALRAIPLSLCYFGAAVAILIFDGYLRMLPPGHYFPPNAPALIQNIFKGPSPTFPITPWLAFAFGGGAVGALLRHFHSHVGRRWFFLSFLALASVIKLFTDLVQWLADDLPTLAAQYWVYGRAGDVFILLGILMALENRVKMKWFLDVGKHTFPIFILHVIILYGGLFGIGLSPTLAHALTPVQAAIGAALFVAFFVALVPLMESIAGSWKKLRERPAPRSVSGHS